MNITIPPEALDAFLCEVAAHNENLSGEAARAACLAMIQNWSGMVVTPEFHHPLGSTPANIILPLTQENSND